jgi:3-dehydroquinate dehydratase
MNKAFILFIKEPQQLRLFGSLKQLYKEHGDLISKALRTLYDINFDLEDYEDENVKIANRPIIRSKHNFL